MGDRAWSTYLDPHRLRRRIDEAEQDQDRDDQPSDDVGGCPATGHDNEHSERVAGDRRRHRRVGWGWAR